LTDPTPDPSVSVEEAARFLEIPEDEARGLAGAGGRVSLEAIRGRFGAAVLARELAKASEEAGRLSGQLKEVRASNGRLRKELQESREERLMLMERIEHIARVEQDLEESSMELGRLRSRRLLDRLLNR